jgi:alkaline phosphatase
MSRSTTDAGGIDMTVLRAIVFSTLLVSSAPLGAADANDGPRDLILMVADGCGFHHFTVSSMFAGTGARGQVVWEFPVQVAMSTWPHGGGYDPDLAWSDAAWLSRHPTDSAAAITAMTTGVKTHNTRLCVDARGVPLTPLVDLFERSGKATGVVATVMFSHATPAGFVISDPDRNAYERISRAMLTASPIDVIMGPGHPAYDNSGRPVTRPDYRFVGGEDTWRDLQLGRAFNDADGDGRDDPWTLVTDRAAVQALVDDAAPPSRLLVIPRVFETLQCYRDGDRLADPDVVPFIAGIPTLSEMSLAALNVLARDPDGFGVLLEGGAVDWASHARWPGRLVEEQREFDAAVATVVDWIDARRAWDRTLLVVTSDHECGCLCGPAGGDRLMPPPVDRGKGQLPEFRLCTGEHTHALVPLFARGAGAEDLGALAVREDPVRGRYLDIAELGTFLRELASSTIAAEERVTSPASSW